MELKCMECNFESNEESDFFDIDICVDCAKKRGFIGRNGIITELGKKFKVMCKKFHDVDGCLKCQLINCPYKLEKLTEVPKSWLKGTKKSVKYI